MLTSWEDVLIILACITGALAVLFVLQYVWPSSQRRLHNDVIGWHITVLGTTYAVIIGFMLYAVWSSFQAADINSDNEANCLVNVFRLADGLPEAQRSEIHRLAREYVNVVIDEEWPAMANADLSLAGHPIVEQLWATAVQTKPATFGEQTSMNLTLEEISAMTRYRRVRQLESSWRLPGVLWLLMILGGLITTLASCLFGTENFKLHILQVVTLTLLVSLTLVAIADIDRPFQGSVHVYPRGFIRARETFDHMPLESLRPHKP
jgi:hypothetical protein